MDVIICQLDNFFLVTISPIKKNSLSWLHTANNKVNVQLANTACILICTLEVTFS